VSSLPVKVEPVNTSLAFFESAKQALAICATIDEVKEIRDRAEALRVYQRQSGESLTMQNQCCEIKLRAERRAGEILKGMPKQNGARGTGKKVESHDGTPLSDLGINKNQSSRWQALADIPEPTFDEFIETTKSKGRELTSSCAHRLAKAERVKAEASKPKPKKKTETNIITDLSEVTTKFRCVYADPPWQYGNQATRAATNNHYVTMTIEKIAALPIASIVEDKAVLFLWTTNGFLFESKQIIDAWGFEFKSSMVWVKDQMGIGNYVRNAHEFLLICSRGGLRTNGKSQKSWIQSPRTKHSRKPACFRQIVEEMCDGPRIELFARQAAPGWVSWGNEVESTLFAG
jgi:N6-adenosine-specific RNA methylase IME4